VSDEEIIERLMFSMINEGALILEEGIAMRSSDIRCCVRSWLWHAEIPRCGPMRYADTVGLSNVVAAMEKYRERYGDMYWTPAPLLKRLAEEGGSFSD
jgi:3-hydroxyacyl-CoA dehydrogenase